MLYITDAARKVLKRYLKTAGITEGTVFRHNRRDGSVQLQRLTAVSPRRIIKAQAKAAGVDSFISEHSLRGSGLARQGRASVIDVQVAGRWQSSEMPAHYAKAELAERGAIARFKDGKL